MSESENPESGGKQAAPPLSLDTARQRIINSIKPVRDAETVALADARGRVLAQDIVSSVNVPSADNASMDGYALALTGVEASTQEFAVVAIVYAGHVRDQPLAPGECVRIMTGAAVPPGTDAVVIQENTVADTALHTVRVEKMPPYGDNIRPAGEDIAAGDTVLAAGQYLRPADIAVLASVGCHRVPVVRRPRVAFFSTGDELRPIDGPLARGEIYDSNRYGLAASLAELGMDRLDLGAVPDDRDALAQAFRKASDCDAVITSGGVSVGDADFVLDVLGKQGEIDLWRVAIKPGKPLAFGRIGAAYFFGLPGNPVSTAVTFIQLVRPALTRLAGGRPAPPLRLTLPTTHALSKRAGRAHYLRACMNLDGPDVSVTPLDHQGSGVMRSMSRADAFIVLPAEAADMAAGTAVTVEPFAQAIWQDVSAQ